MEQIETQVSDLRYLSQAAAPEADSAAGGGSSAGGGSPANSSNRRQSAAAGAHHHHYSHHLPPSQSSSSSPRGPPLRGSAAISTPPSLGKMNASNAGSVVSPAGSASAGAAHGDNSAHQHHLSQRPQHMQSAASSRAYPRPVGAGYAGGILDDMRDEDLREMSVASTPGKRKAEDSGNAKQTRSKRNRVSHQHVVASIGFISVAVFLASFMKAMRMNRFFFPLLI